MPLFDFLCPECSHIESDVLIPSGHAVDVWCIGCPGISCEYVAGYLASGGARVADVRMVRRIGVPAPAVFTRGGTGASRGTR